MSGEENIRVNHIAFRVPDVAAAHRELQATGLIIAGSPHLVPSTGRTNVNFRDPEAGVSNWWMLGARHRTPPPRIDRRRLGPTSWTGSP